MRHGLRSSSLSDDCRLVFKFFCRNPRVVNLQAVVLTAEPERIYFGAFQALDEVTDRLKNVLLRLCQVIVHDEGVKLRSKTHFIFRLIQTHLDGFGRFSTSLFQTLTECRNRRGLNEDGQTPIGIMTF